MTLPISTYTITQNASDCIGVVLEEAAKQFAEINVVVAPSEDNTVEIVEDLAARYNTINIQHHPFDGFSPQWQRALDMCTGEWSLQIASDELLNPRTPWLEYLNGEHDAWFFNRWWVYSDLQSYSSTRPRWPDPCVRLSRRELTRVQQARIHEALQVAGSVDRSPITHEDSTIIHLSEIRSDYHLKIKGKHRIGFAGYDGFNAPAFKSHGEEAFIHLKHKPHSDAAPLPQYAIDYLARLFPNGLVHDPPEN